MVFEGRTPKFKFLASISSFVGSLLLLVIINVSGAFYVNSDFVVQYGSVALIVLGAWGLRGTIRQYQQGYSMGGELLDIRLERVGGDRRFWVAFFWNAARCAAAIGFGIYGLWFILTYPFGF